jgi:hypothetical protein
LASSDLFLEFLNPCLKLLDLQGAAQRRTSRNESRISD